MRKELIERHRSYITEEYSSVNSLRAVNALRQKVAMFVFGRRFTAEELTFLNFCIESDAEDEDGDWAKSFNERYPDLPVRVHVGHGSSVEENWGNEQKKGKNVYLRLDLYRRNARIDYWTY